MRVLVCGGRDFTDAMTLGSYLGGLHKEQPITLLINGGAPGADWLAKRWAEWMRVPVETYPAAWKTFGHAAGPIRNQQMLDKGKPHCVVAFPGGRGTADMVRRAKDAGIKVYEIPALPARANTEER